MNRKITIIGAGNMGSAIIEGMINSNITSQSSICISDLNSKKLNIIQQKFPEIETTTDNGRAIKNANIIIFAIKPIDLEKIIFKLKNSISPTQLIVSICAGIPTKKIEMFFGKKIKVVRAMPNTPSLVNEGMSALSKGKFATDDDLKLIQQIFTSFGLVEIVPEYLMDTVTAVSGSSPAYAFMLIEAMADGAVLNGMSRKTAIKMAAQSLKGAAEMVLATETHPCILKDMVTSPGGTTITALASLENGGFRSSIIEAMSKCVQKSQEMID